LNTCYYNKFIIDEIGFNINERKDKVEDTLVNSIKKAFDILDILVFEDIHNNGLSLTKLSEKTQIKTNTLHNILKTMIYCGYVEQNSNSHYLAGKRCKQIGIINRFQITPELSTILHTALYGLNTNTNESVAFYVLANGERINYINIQSKDIIKVDYTMLEENSIYEYPSGKILVAFCDKEELKKIIAKHGYPQEYWNNISDAEELEKEIMNIRKSGYINCLSSDKKIVNYAIPAFTSDGKLLGSIGLYIPAFRNDEKNDSFMLTEIIQAAEYIKDNSKS
jgi:DNA-binding IclR family transcriptional regulator